MIKLMYMFDLGHIMLISSVCWWMRAYMPTWVTVRSFYMFSIYIMNLCLCLFNSPYERPTTQTLYSFAELIKPNISWITSAKYGEVSNLTSRSFCDNLVFCRYSLRIIRLWDQQEGSPLMDWAIETVEVSFL